MPSRRIEWQVGISADTSKLEASLQKALSSLSKIGSMSIGGNISNELRTASLAATELQQNLLKATNTANGSFSLRSFQESLAASGKTLAQYQQELAGLGSTGQQAFLQVASAITQAEVPIRRTSKLFDSLWVTMKNTMRWQLTTSALRTFTGALSTAYGYAKDLNESLNNIRIVTQKSTEDMAEFADRANNAAKALSTTTTNYTDASLIYYQQGLSDAEVEERTNATIKLANVAGISAEQASEQLTAIWNNFDDGTRSLESYVDVMVKLGAETASSSSEISEGIRKFAAVADTVGLSYDYAAAALATVTATTRESADIVGTAYRTLFARIQGLQQGETLDDGTDLNKYSKALANVGISIKDTNGELRDMDDILDDLGNRWQTLSKDQQVALAETVAGVRQYTQLVALMDSWDFFQENLDRARDSEGALQEQADIYAESWEASRDRVRAAAEDIYASLVNPETFIGLNDHVIVPFLGFLDNVIEGLGGFRGILINLLPIITTLFENQLAQGLRDAAYNIQVLTGKAQEMDLAFKQQASDLAQKYIEENANNPHNTATARVEAEAKEVQMQADIATVAERVSETQMQQLVNLKNQVTRLREISIEYDKIAEKEKERSDVNAENIIKQTGFHADASDAVGGPIRQTNEYYNGFNAFGNMMTEARAQFGDSLDEDIIEVSNAEVLAATEGTEEYTKALQKYNEELKVARELEEEALQTKHAEFYDAYKTKALEASKAMKQYETDFTSGSEAITKAIDRVTDISPDFKIDVGKVIDSESANTAIQDLANIQGQMDGFRQRLKNLSPEMQANQQVMQGLADEFTEITGIQVAATFNDLAQAVDTVEEGCIDTADIIQEGLVNSVQGGAAAVEQVTNKLDKMREASFNAGQAVQKKKIAVEQATEAEKKFGQALEESGNKTQGWASKIIQTAQTLTRIVMVVNNIKNLGGIITDDDVSNGEKFVQILTNVGMILPAIMQLLKADPITKTIGLVIIAITAAVEVFKALHVTAEEAADNIQKAADEYKEAQEEVEELNDKLKTTQERIAELKSQGPLSFTEKEELNNLERQSALLERQLELQKAIAAEKAREAMNEFDENFDELAEGYEKYRKKETKEEDFLKDYWGIDELPTTREQASVIALENVIPEVRDTYAWAKNASDEAIVDWIGRTQYRGNTEESINYAANNILTIATDALEEDRQYRADHANELNKYNQALLAMGDTWSTYLTGLEGDASYWQEASRIMSSDAFQAFGDVVRNEVIRDDDEKYYELYIKPAFDTTALGEVKDELEELQGKVDENSDPATVLRNLKLTDEEIQDVMNYLVSSGLYLSDIINGIDIPEHIPDKLDWSTSEAQGTDMSYVTRFHNFTDEDWDDAAKLGVIDGETVEEWFARWDTFKSQVEEEPLEVKIKVDSTEFSQALDALREGIQSGEIDYTNIFDNESYQAVIDGIKELAEEYPELITYVDTLSENWEVGTQKYLEALDKVQKVVGQIRLKSLVEDAKEAEEKFESFFKDGFIIGITANMDEFEETLNSYLDAQYSIDIEVHTQAEQEFEGFVAALDNIREIAGYIGDDFIVSADKIRVLGNTFPDILTNMTYLKDGTVQLNEDVVTSVLSSAQAEVQADADSAKGRLQIQAQILREKQQSYLRMAEAAHILATTESDEDEKSAEAREIINNELNKIKEDNNRLSTNQILQNEAEITDKSKTNTERLAANYVESYRIATDASAQSAEAQITNQAAITEGNLDKIVKWNYTVKYNGASGVSGEAKVLGLTEETLSNTGNGTQNAWALMEEKFRALADSMGAGANDIESMITSIDAYVNEVGAGFGNVGRGNNSGKGGSSKQNIMDEYNPEDDYVEDRYHEINRAIQDIEDSLTDIDDATDRAFGTRRLDLYKQKLSELDKQVTNYNKKLTEAQDYLKKDRDALQEAFGWSEKELKSRIGLNGEILSYQGILDEMNAETEAYAKKYKEFRARYNAAGANQEAIEAAKTALEEEKKKLDELHQKRLDALKQYEDTVDEIQSIKDAWEDAMRTMEDLKLESVTYKMDIIVEFKNAEDEIRDFDRKVTESFSDSLFNTYYGRVFNSETGRYENQPGTGTFDKTAEQARAEMALITGYEDEYNGLMERLNNANQWTDMDALKSEFLELSSNVLQSADALLEYAESLEEVLPNAVAAARERFDEFNDELEHNASVLEAIQELYELQNQTYKTEQGFNRLQQNATARLDAAMKQAAANRQWNTLISNNLANAQSALDALYAKYDGDIMAAESDVMFDKLKADRDALLEEFNASEEAMYESAAQAMEIARDMYLQQVEKATYDFGKALAGADLTLDILQDRYDHYIEENDRYLDSVNEAYQVATWYNKLQADIDKSTNANYTKQLKALQDEINLRRESGTLSEYDLEILEAKYKVAQAQAALDDAQNAKTELRLVRDRQGNWNYQYTANQDEVAQKQQELLDAENEWYNIAKQQVQDVTREIIDTWAECQDALNDIYSDMELTEEERQRKIEELQRYYNQKITDLEREKAVALQDINEGANHQLETAAEATQEYMLDIATDFDDTWANMLSSMTDNTAQFADTLDKTIGDCNGYLGNYEAKVDEVARESGSDLSTLDQRTNDLRKSTEDLATAWDANSYVWDEMLEKVQSLRGEYEELITKALEYINLARQLGGQGYDAAVAADAKSRPDDAFWQNLDFSTVEAAALASGNEDAYNILEEFRNAKSATMDKDKYLTRGEDDAETHRKRIEGLAQNGSWNENTWGGKTLDDLLTWLFGMDPDDIQWFDTGGYTGNFDNARLAFLHQKELVLNPEDTENILSAVSAIRLLDADKLRAIEAALDGQAFATLSYLSRSNGIGQINASSQPIDQNIQMDISFPAVTDRVEIEEALSNLINDAAQWARRRI